MKICYYKKQKNHVTPLGRGTGYLILPLSIGLPLLLLSSLILSSCDPFYVGPMGRFNPQDEYTSLIRLDAYSYGEDEILLGWNWLDQERAARKNSPLLEPQWDKIVIKEKRGSMPTSRLGGTEISVGDDTWYKVFNDLENDSEYHFALWPHEKNGGWLAPVYIRRHVEWTGTSGDRTATAHEAYKLNLDTNTYVNIAEVSESRAEVKERVWYFLFFDGFDEGMTVKSAELKISIDTENSTGSLIVHPVRWTEGDFFSSWPEEEANRERQFATETFVDRTIDIDTAEFDMSDDGRQSIDITEVFQRALYHGINILVFRASEGSTVTIDATVPPEITYNGVWKW